MVDDVVGMSGNQTDRAQKTANGGPTLSVMDILLILAVLAVLLIVAWWQKPPYDSYADYLRSPKWRRKRQQALKRDGYRCRICNRRDSLEVHHRRYPARLGTETLDDLTVCCADCHDALTRLPWVPGSHPRYTAL